MTNWKQRALYALMSEISEDCYCAGWMMGTEYTLWEIISEFGAKRNWGQGEVQQWQIDDLHAISVEIGGWIRWRDDHEEPGLHHDEWGPVFTPMAEWLAMYQERVKK